MHRPFVLPGARPRYAPDRAFDVTHIRLEVVLDFEQRSLSGTAILRLQPIGAARETRPLALDAVEMEIVSVAVGGSSAEFDYDGETLRLTVPAAGATEVA